MAKRKSTKPGKARETEPKNDVPRGVRKHLRELERQLTDAARQESKRLRKLEKSVFRRQMIQAALEELRGEASVAIAPVVQVPAPKAAAPAAPAPTPAAKGATTRSRSATVRTRVVRPSKASGEPAPEKPEN